MKRLLITGADGFVGRWLVRAARAARIPVIAGVHPASVVPAEWHDAAIGPPVRVVAADLLDDDGVARLADTGPDAVVHLAAVASGAEARSNPDAAIAVNATATVLLASLLTGRRPRFLFVSTAEVYGAGHAGPIPESAPVAPVSPYGASKAAAESALAAIAARTSLPLIVARAFPHSGPGQTTSYVLPALAARLRDAKRTGRSSIATGNLSGIRDFLDVRDVVRAYLLLLETGTPGEIYNVASGTGRRLADCFGALARIIGVDATPAEDASLLRPGDIPALIGDAAKLRAATGWTPSIPFDRTLSDLVNAQAN